MSSQTNTTLKSKPSIFYGWYIVFIAGLGIFFSGPGQTYSISAFIESYIHHFGWSRSLVSGIYSSATLTAGILLLVVGRLIDQYGQRLMMVIVGILFSLACLWNSLVTQPWMLFVGFFLIRLLGQGSMTLIPSTLVPQWFIRQRGRAMSLMAIGGFLGSALVPPINGYLIHRLGWQYSWIVWGMLLLVIFVPLAGFFVRNRPEDMGLQPDNGLLKHQDNSTDSSFTERSWTLKEAIKTKAFWLILYCVGVPALVNTAIVFHLPSILKGNGLDMNLATIILSIMAMVGFPMTFVSGYAVDLFKVNRVLAIAYMAQLTVLTFFLSVESSHWIVLIALIWGIQNGVEQITLNVIWPNYFGRAYLGSIRGVAMMTTVVSSAFGPVLYGVAYDYFYGYKEVILATMLLPAIAILSSLALKKPDISDHSYKPSKKQMI
ncbi:MFS transporter [Paenactinomyces guangxiensis]|uniref:MFS transporter n=1 Tax=Paenactinomyces guangxiensis TaxID=1490290 RepID=A0A7W2A9C2_9BACL|nr:MFS transporter [Paenactinomyces guangxiensis]MBA4495079.1 MFS transporter [Paenactinomyces guangxiensis]MBH8592237.1 MFS transporter [Paenactinomyces guangxiensis]